MQSSINAHCCVLQYFMGFVDTDGRMQQRPQVRMQAHAAQVTQPFSLQRHHHLLDRGYQNRRGLVVSQVLLEFVSVLDRHTVAGIVRR